MPCCTMYCLLIGLNCRYLLLTLTHPRLQFMIGRCCWNRPPYCCERDYTVYSIPLDPDENTKRAALLNVPPRESHRLWNYGDLSYFNSSRYRTDVRMRLLGTACSPLSEWWILPAEAVRTFCAVVPSRTRKTRKMRRKG